MKVYYKGFLIDSEETSDIFKITSVSTKSYCYNSDNEDLRLSEKDLTYYENNIYDWHKKYDGITDGKLIEVLKKIPNVVSKQVNEPTYIFFEIVKDNSGNEYGKELITGLLFPLRKKANTEKFFYGINKPWIIEKVQTYKDNNIARFKYIVHITEVASMNDVKNYLDIKNTTKNLITFKNKIEHIYNENIFKNEIELIDEEPLEKQNETTKVMEDLEYLLKQLKKHNNDLYIKYTNKYKELIETNHYSNNYYEPQKRDFINLLSSIKLALVITNENCDNINEYLDVIITKYLDKIINDEIDEVITNINIDDIENLNDMFLKDKNNYSIINQRNILKKISLLYLLVVKVNIDKININDLNNSYFNDNIKTILIYIDELKIENIINCDINIDFVKNYFPNEVIEIIRNIKFNKIDKENIKKLIR